MKDEGAKHALGIGCADLRVWDGVPLRGEEQTADLGDDASSQLSGLSWVPCGAGGGGGGGRGAPSTQGALHQ